MSMNPENRMEQILAGENITPENRTEAFTKEAIDNASGGGGGGNLPTPGTAGNVMTSTGSAWESAAPPTVTVDSSITENGTNPVTGGAIYDALADVSVLVCTFTMGESMTCDVDVADIVAALAANRPVLGIMAGAGTLSLKNWNAELNKVVFLFATLNNNEYTLVEIMGESGTPDTWEFTPKDLIGVPDTSGNNGKVLGVDNGSVEWVSPTSLSNAPYTIHITTSGNTMTTTETAGDIVAALNAEKVISTYQKLVMGEGTAEEVTVWSVRTFVGVWYVAAEGYTLIVAEYDGDNDTWKKYEFTAASANDVFSYTE